jgi:hypothetical protein
MVLSRSIEYQHRHVTSLADTTQAGTCDHKFQGFATAGLPPLSFARRRSHRLAAVRGNIGPAVVFQIREAIAIMLDIPT